MEDEEEYTWVKLYCTGEDGKWEYHGIGYIIFDCIERNNDFGLCVYAKKDHEALLMHRILPDDIYRRKGRNISWRDPERSIEFALRFKEKTGCSYIWDQICDEQTIFHLDTGNHETFHRDLKELPPVNLSTLPLILKIVVERGITDKMRVSDLILRDQDFFRKLMDTFVLCEDLENLDSLYLIYRIVKGIIMLNSPLVLEKIFGDDLIMDTIACLEYDPEGSHVRHRDFLNEHVVFKEAIPIKDPNVLSKIHQTYRIGYLKDVVLTRVLDDATLRSLNSMIHANNGIVVSLLKDDSTFMKELFLRMRSPSISSESKKELVYFLIEFCNLSKSLQKGHQLRLFRDLVKEGLFDIISYILQNEDKRLVLTGTDILLVFLNQDPNILRSYVVRPEGTPLLGLLVQGLLTDFGGMHYEFLDILCFLLDSSTLSGSQRDAIFEVFYERHLGQFIDVIASSCPAGGSSLVKYTAGDSTKMNTAKPEILLNISELLCFCVLYHPEYRIKRNFVLNNLMDKVLFLTHRREKYLVVAAVRFVRTVISRNDEDINSYIIERNLLKPIVDVFVANGDRNNLLNSAVLELFEYIQKENIKPLLKYLGESFWSHLGKFEHLASIQSLKVKYEQSLESIEAKSAIDEDSRKRAEERALDKGAEDYFNKNSSRHVRLVDYDDDESDEDYRPPLGRNTDASNVDRGSLKSPSSKRKMASKEEAGPLPKRQHIDTSPKSRDSMFASLCQVAASIAHNSASHPSNTKQSEERDIHQERETEVVRSINDDNLRSEKK